MIATESAKAAKGTKAVKGASAVLAASAEAMRIFLVAMGLTPQTAPVRGQTGTPTVQTMPPNRG